MLCWLFALLTGQLVGCFVGCPVVNIYHCNRYLLSAAPPTVLTFLVGGLVDWLVGWLVALLVGGFVGWFIGLLVGSFLVVRSSTFTIASCTF